MKKILGIMLVFLVLAGPVSAFDAATAFSALDISELQASVNEASADVKAFFGPTPINQIVIVTGSRINAEDKILFNLLKSNLNIISGIPVVTDKQFDHPNKHLVLIGSEKTNTVTKNLAENNQLTEREEKDYSPLIIEMAVNGDYKVLMLYSKREKVNVQNTAVQKSPLNNLMPEKYVPAAATLLSIFLLYLWQILGSTGLELLNEAISSKLLDRWSRKKKIKKHSSLHKGEILAFIVYVLVFSSALAYSWSSTFDGFLNLFGLNLIIVGIISLVRELARIRSCFRLKLKSEYVVWPMGAVVTLLSTFLGNTFSMVSYVMLDEDETDHKKFGKFSFVITALTFLFAIVTYIINIVSPSLVLQMMFVFAILLVFIELFPMSPMPGYDIKKWSFPLWLVSYAIAIATYIYMNFTVYI